MQIVLCGIVILTIFILPIQKCGASFHLSVQSLISFISVLQFSEYGSFGSLGRFIPSYFILFDVMVNGMVSLICLSDISLIVYRNAINFCVLSCILRLCQIHGGALTFFWQYLYDFLGIANSNSFISSFPIWIPFISFTSLNAEARTSKTMLNKSGKSGNPCLVPDLGRNSFRFSLL